jgi:hypothetical protein
MAIPRQRSTGSAVGLAVTLIVTLGVGTVAARPNGGGRDIQDYAQASFQVRLEGDLACFFVDATVRYFAGDNLQGPIGSGTPGSWSDAPVNLGVFDSCNNDVEVLHLEGLGFPDVGPDIYRLERASLDVTSVTLTDGLGTSVDAEIHLVWLGNGDATVRIDHQLDAGYFRQERSVTAAVSGTVELGASPYWSELTFAGSDARDGSVGTANEISLP